MEEVAISEFKAKCFALLERVRQTKKPLRITRFGKPVAEIVPPSPDAGPADWIGSMKGSMEILGDCGAGYRRARHWGITRLKLLLDTHVWQQARSMLAVQPDGNIPEKA